MDSLHNVITDLKVFFYGGLSNLPVCIGGTMLLIGLFTAHYSLLFFVLMMFVIVPIAVKFLNMILGAFSFNRGPMADICKVLPGYTRLQNAEVNDTDIISPWVPMMAAFVGYLSANMYYLYTLKPTDKSSDEKVARRRYQLCVAFCTILVFTAIFMYYRMKSGCESISMDNMGTALMYYGGMMVLFGGFIGLGIAWYKILHNVSDRLADVFGIANRVLLSNDAQDQSVLCLPVTVS